MGLITVLRSNFWRGFLVSEKIPANWAILASERAAVLGDVPFFGTCTDQTTLLLDDGARIEDYFICPSYDAARAKLQNLNEHDHDFQIGLDPGGDGGIRGLAGAGGSRHRQANAG